MIVLDTNVLSALMQREPDPVVVAWLDRQPSESVWTTAITVFEICFGLELLAAGRRRQQLEDAFRRALAEDMENRILPFDDQSAREAGARAAQRRTEEKVVDFRTPSPSPLPSTRWPPRRRIQGEAADDRRWRAAVLCDGVRDVHVDQPVVRRPQHGRVGHRSRDRRRRSVGDRDRRRTGLAGSAAVAHLERHHRDPERVQAGRCQRETHRIPVGIERAVVDLGCRHRRVASRVGGAYHCPALRDRRPVVDDDERGAASMPPAGSAGVSRSLLN